MKQKRLFFKAAVLALLFVSLTLISWETYLRSQGRGLSFDDGGSLWSDKRKQVYEPIDKATVFIGTSRIKYDLDIPTWQNTTGDHAIQLANVGSSPRAILDDLAADKNFKGKLVIDATEILFFTQAPYVNKTPAENIEYFKRETPAQKFSFAVNHALESNLYFLDKEEYSLNALLAGARIPNRPNVYEFPDFPADFTPVTFDRQCYMSANFVKDTNMLNQVKMVWAMFGKMSAEAPPITEGAVDGIMASVKVACDKIKARGGEVIFVRPPSSGPLLAMEKMAFPKEKFWNKLLAITACQGVYFEDYPAIAKFKCPEFSHLSLPQAITFTKTFINIVKEKGWKFPSPNNTIALTSSKL
ncbi:MAG: hypothetical protein WKF89_02010 [Chitinophagaceae bacterium]